MSTGDPDLDAVLSESSAPAKKSGDPDLDAVIAESKSPAKGAAPTQSTAPDADTEQFRKQQGRAPTQDELASIRAGHQGNAVGALLNSFVGAPLRGAVAGWRGIFDLASGKSGAQAAGDVAETSATEAPTSASGRAVDATLSSPYNPLNYIDEAGEYLGNKAADAGAPPGVSTALRIGPDAVASALGFGKGNMEHGPLTVGEPEAVARAPHPLAGAVEADTERLGAMKDRGANLGLQLPEGGTPAQHAAASVANREPVNTIVKNSLGIPDEIEGSKVDLTPQVLDAAREHYGSPAYKAISDVPVINLNKTYERAIGNVDLSQINEKFRPPTNGMMTGEEAVEMSRYLRNRANKLYTAAKGNPLLEDAADAHWDAAEAVEDAVRDHLDANGQPELAANWDKARTYIAKTYNVQQALDGAGNVNVGNLKSQLRKNAPLSGDLEMLANLGARYPLAFRLTQESAPNPGLMRRAASYAAPKVATAGGAAIGGSLFGPWGAAGGAAVGKLTGDRVAEKILPQ